MKRLEMVLTDSTGRLVGKIEDYTICDAEGKKVYEAKPKATLDEIIRILLTKSRKDVV